jgi:hypothetical protein
VFAVSLRAVCLSSLTIHVQTVEPGHPAQLVDVTRRQKIEGHVAAPAKKSIRTLLTTMRKCPVTWKYLHTLWLSGYICNTPFSRGLWGLEEGSIRCFCAADAATAGGAAGLLFARRPALESIGARGPLRISRSKALFISAPMVAAPPAGFTPILPARTHGRRLFPARNADLIAFIRRTRIARVQSSRPFTSSVIPSRQRECRMQVAAR